MSADTFSATDDAAPPLGRRGAVTLLFASFWAWQTSVNFAPVVQSELSQFGQLWYAGNVFICLGYALLACFATRLEHMVSFRPIELVAIASQLLDTLLFLLPLFIGSSPQFGLPFFVCHLILLSLGTVLLAPLLFKRLVTLPARKGRGVVILGGTLCSLFMCLLIGSLPLILSATTLLSLPIVEFVLLRSIDSRPMNLIAPRNDPGTPSQPSAYVLAAIFPLALSLNFIRRSTGSDNMGSTEVIATVIVLLAASFAAERMLGMRLVRSTGRGSAAILVILVGVGMMYSVATEETRLAASVLAMAGYLYYVTMLWRLPAELALHQGGAHWARTFSITFCLNALGLLCGSACSHIHATMAPGSLVLPLLIAYVAFIGCAYIFTKARTGETSKQSLTDTPLPQVDSRLDVSIALRDQCSRISAGKGLTARELDVLYEIASGKSMPAIAQAMGLSVNTVKSHAAHVYNKLDVHSRDDIIDLMNDARRSELDKDDILVRR